MKYELNKKDFKKYLKYRRSSTNIIFLIIGSLLYFYITFYLLFDNPFMVFIYYLLYLFALLVFILLFNELYSLLLIKKNHNIFCNYEFNINKDKIIVKINNNYYEYLNSNISKIRKNKRYILIKYNNYLVLLFIKKLIGDKFNNLKQLI